MTFSFRPAKREAVGLLVGLAGPSGSGKTFSALRLAKGIAGDRPFALLDTEAGRAKHYADRFAFDHGDLTPPFTPARYGEAIAAADAAGYPVIVVDSASHEHAGEGGILDMQLEELERLAKGDDARREIMKMASWIKPKTEHKRFVSRLLQIRAHLILCFRAEEKIDMVRENGRLVVKPKVTLTSLDGWIPICEKSLPFELTASFLLLPSAPGVPRPIKLQEQHKAFFPADREITEAAGAALAQWAAGVPRTGATLAGVVSPPKPSVPNGGTSGVLTNELPPDLARTFRGRCKSVTPAATPGGKKYYDVTVDRSVFVTTLAHLADQADALKGRAVVVTYHTAGKGKQWLDRIEAAA